MKAGVFAASPSSCSSSLLPRPHYLPKTKPLATSLSSLTPLPLFDLSLSSRAASTKSASGAHAAKHPPPATKRKNSGKRRAPEKPPAERDGLAQVTPVAPDSQLRRSHPSPLPKPPAGFLLDQHGRVLLAASKRIATIVNDEEVETIIPAAAYALAKVHMHLVFSGLGQQIPL
ncbi:hypothetical protein B296_00007848 [Ensete ventricosum]|uniref:Uncharacterized protein n=1 Tax=Ensete ventricosum TaxID=4639 RepID=A0A426YQL8_ENSVE|nr:hypothetical protein B296_00007848 [Ensete ventricosum]